jgi:hypothetical protein
MMVAGMLPDTTRNAAAMDLKIVGNQLILSGLVVGDEFGKVEKILDDDPTIDT